MTSFSQLLSALFLSLVNLTVIVSADDFQFKPTVMKDCVAAANRTVVSARSDIECSTFCSSNKLCKGHKMTGNDCHLLLSSWNQTCTASDEIIWIKKENLCPVDFGHELKGIKYKVVISYKTQADAIAHCQSLGVNSRLADALDHEELLHLANITTGIGSNNVWLDGAQVPGATEPAGGWKWTAAGVDLDPSMWWTANGDPDNGSYGNQHSASLCVPVKTLADVSASETLPSVCECNAVLN